MILDYEHMSKKIFELFSEAKDNSLLPIILDWHLEITSCTTPKIKVTIDSFNDDSLANKFKISAILLDIFSEDSMKIWGPANVDGIIRGIPEFSNDDREPEEFIIIIKNDELFIPEIYDWCYYIFALENMKMKDAGKNWKIFINETIANCAKDINETNPSQLLCTSNIEPNEYHKQHYPPYNYLYDPKISYSIYMIQRNEALSKFDHDYALYLSYMHNDLNLIKSNGFNNLGLGKLYFIYGSLGYYNTCAKCNKQNCIIARFTKYHIIGYCSNCIVSTYNEWSSKIKQMV